jgi:hypothetical protein
MNITIPALILGAVLATLYGALFHLWRGGRAGRLLLYLILSWVGFWAGHFLGMYFGWSFLKIGALQFGAATVGSALALLAGYWLSPVKTQGR